MLKQQIINSLVEIEAIKFGEFRLKSGILSPIYIDLRIIISYPNLLEDIATAMIALSKEITFDKVAGIPYTALPIATAFSLKDKVPMIYSRKEKKEYGTSQQIEGVWKPNDRVLIIDDLITNGGSKIETFKVFEGVGLNIKDVVVLIDREQGGRELLFRSGYQLHSLISIFELLDHLRKTGEIDAIQYNKTIEFLKTNK